MKSQLSKPILEFYKKELNKEKERHKEGDHPDKILQIERKSISIANQAYVDWERNFSQNINIHDASGEFNSTKDYELSDHTKVRVMNAIAAKLKNFCCNDQQEIVAISNFLTQTPLFIVPNLYSRFAERLLFQTGKNFFLSNIPIPKVLMKTIH